MIKNNNLKLFYSELKYIFRFPFPEILFSINFIIMIYLFKTPQSVNFYFITYNYYVYTYIIKNVLSIFLLLDVIYSVIISIKFSLQLSDGSISSYMLFPINKKYFLLSKIISLYILVILSEMLSFILFILIANIKYINIFYTSINILIWSFFTISIAIYISLLLKNISSAIITLFICIYPIYFSTFPNLFQHNYYMKGIIYGPAVLNFIKFKDFSNSIIYLYLSIITILFISLIIIILSIGLFTKIEMRGGK